MRVAGRHCGRGKSAAVAALGWGRGEEEAGDVSSGSRHTFTILRGNMAVKVMSVYRAGRRWWCCSVFGAAQYYGPTEQHHTWLRHVFMSY